MWGNRNTDGAMAASFETMRGSPAGTFALSTAESIIFIVSRVDIAWSITQREGQQRSGRW